MVQGLAPHFLPVQRSQVTGNPWKLFAAVAPSYCAGFGLRASRNKMLFTLTEKKTVTMWSWTRTWLRIPISSDSISQL